VHGFYTVFAVVNSSGSCCLMPVSFFSHLSIQVKHDAVCCDLDKINSLATIDVCVSCLLATLVKNKGRS